VTVIIALVTMNVGAHTSAMGNSEHKEGTSPQAEEAGCGGCGGWERSSA
jgi:hypothetical protein